jgi:hypothetical protein
MDLIYFFVGIRLSASSFEFATRRTLTFEPSVRIELTTSSLPRKRSTPELRRLENDPALAGQNNERKTRLELATYSLEGYRSTK